MAYTLSTSVSKLYRVGPKQTKLFKKLGIETVRDLLFHFPQRYDDFSTIVDIKNLEAGQIFTIKGTIVSIDNKKTPRKKKIITEAYIEDFSGRIKAVWFNQPFLTKTLQKGLKILLSGKVEYDFGELQYINPTYELLKKDQTHTGRIVPVYSVTEGLTSKMIRFHIKTLLRLVKYIKEYIPEEILKRQKLIGIQEAIKQIHFPDSKLKLQKARERLAFDELFLIQLYALSQRKKWQDAKSVKIEFNEKLVKSFVKTIPYKLTNAQRRAAWEILKDLEKSVPMNRLLEGDVGSGKTVVACIAILETVKAGFQVAYMAPTELLAYQHFNTIAEFLSKFRIRIALLTASWSLVIDQLTSTKKKFKLVFKEVDRRDLLFKIQERNIDILIGTHALIQENVKFNNLALIIIDEQHRFGVEQRKALRDKTSDLVPHLLSMTATPIPRTLALTVYGDLDISVIEEMPPGRQKVLTMVVPPEKRGDAYRFIRNQVKLGKQVFVICPLIEESDKLGVKSAIQEYEKLSKEIFPDLKIGLLHGKLKTKEKEEVIKSFYNKKIDILVSTSVVEVGVDIQNATVMMIEGADRFGLAQLHQLRGRVGRDKTQSYCFLFSDSSSQKAIRRLNALVRSQNGFELAEKDLEMRGPGEIYGIRQSGLIDLKIAKLSDIITINKARESASKLLNKDPELRYYPILAKKLKEFGDSVHFE